jgi:hypothetical protein
VIFVEVPEEPLAPIIVALEITIDLMFLFLVLWCLRKAFQATFGALLLLLADAISKVPLVGGKLASPIRGLYDVIEHGLSVAEAQALKGAARSWDGVRFLVEYTADTLVRWAGASVDALNNLTKVYIPHLLGQSESTTQRRVGARVKTIQEQQQAEAKTRSKGIDAVTKDLTAEKLAREKGIDYINKGELSRIRAQERALTAELDGVIAQDIPRLWSHVGRLEKLLGALGITSILAHVMIRVWPFGQCRNVRGFNKALCRFPTRLLESLLADALEVAVLVNICEAVKIFTSTAKAFEPELRGIVAVTGAALQCSSLDAPARITGAWVAPPPQQPYAALPGTG